MKKVDNSEMVVTADIGECEEGILFNIAGLPDSPFRTDDWLE